MKSLLLLALLIGLIILLQAPELHSRRSTPKLISLRTPYTKSQIYQNGSKRCLSFVDKKGEVLNQTCLDLAKPLKADAEYIEMMFGLSWLTPKKPRRILIMGLGGGALPHMFRRVYPRAHIDIVEIDHGVALLARRFFQLPTNPKLKIHIADARHFATYQLGPKVSYDLIYIDCFDATYIPQHLLSPRFFRALKKHLTSQGLLAINLFASHASTPDVILTWQKMFSQHWLLRPKRDGNIVAFGSLGRKWKNRSALQAGVRKTPKPPSPQRLKKLIEQAQRASAYLKGRKAKVLKQVAPMKGYPLWIRAARCGRQVCCGWRGRWQGQETPLKKAPQKATKRRWQGTIQAIDGHCIATWQISTPTHQWQESMRLHFTRAGATLTSILVMGHNQMTKTYRLSRNRRQAHGTNHTTHKLSLRLK